MRALFTLLLSCCFLLQLPAQSANLMGFTAESAAAQRAAEAKFDGYIKANNLDEWMKYMSARPHHVGSPYDKKVVDFMAEKFRSWGFDVKVERFDVLFPTPKIRQLELIAPTKYTAVLEELPVPGDPYTEQKDEALPPYNCFSIDGDVTAEASTSKARSLSRSTPVPGGASSPSSPPKKAPSAASSTPTQKTTATTREKPTPTAPTKTNTAYSAVQ